MGPGGHRRRMGPRQPRGPAASRRAQARRLHRPSHQRRRAEGRAGDPSILSQPEQQAKPHPAQCSMRGPQPNLRISRVIDPIGGKVVAYILAGYFGRADRTIWMDGRPRPSQCTEHTWGGFSTGEWVAGGTQLKVTTTHMKTSFINRNGIPSSYRGVMTEFFSVRQHDGAPVDRGRSGVLEEPMVAATTSAARWASTSGRRFRSRPWMNWATARSAGCRTGRWARATPSSPTGSGCRGRPRVAGRKRCIPNTRRRSGRTQEDTEPHRLDPAGRRPCRGRR